MKNKLVNKLVNKNYLTKLGKVVEKGRNDKGNNCFYLYTSDDKCFDVIQVGKDLYKIIVL